MFVNSATDKVFQNENHKEITEQEHSSQEEHCETAHESPSSLPTIFSLAANSSKKAETLEEVVALCREQMDKPLRDRYPPIAYAVKIGRYDAVKFLIDEGESVNAATPDIFVWHAGIAVGVQQGYTPIEIAISQQDVEMVKILTSYHPENRATPELNCQRYVNVRTQKDHYNTDKKQQREESSPLLDALKQGNQEIIDLVIKAYTDPKRLYSEYVAIQKLQEPQAMRSWIQQNVFLWKGEQVEVSEEVTNLFLHKQDLTYSPSDVEKLLQHGWVVTKQEFEKALVANDPLTLRLLLDHTRREEGPFNVLAKHNRADLVAYLIEQGEVLNGEHLTTAITHGSLDVVRTLIEHGVSFDGALLLAIEQKKWAIADYLSSVLTNFDEIVAVCLSQKEKPFPDTYPPVALAVKLGRHDAVKFLIDQGESANAATPDFDVYYWYGLKCGSESGYSPLELAIKMQDVEMVKILTTHNLSNRAVPEFNYHRFKDLTLNNGKYRCSGNYEDSTPLLAAIKLGNQEIVSLVIKAYTDPKRLYAEFTAIQGFGKPSAMRSWIEQRYFLMHGEHKEVLESVVEIFMNKQGLNGSLVEIKTFLQHGWIVTKQEFEQALVANDPQVIQLLVNHPHMEEDPFFALARHNRADLVTYLYERGKIPSQEHLDTAIKHGSQDVAKVFIEQGMPFDSATLFSSVAEHNLADVATYLIQKGIVPVQKHLNTAIMHDAVDVVRILIEHGISSDGALVLAIDNRQLGAARYLASLSKNMYELVELCRAQSNKPLRDRYPPIAFAVQLGRHDLVKFFIDHGESVNEATPDVPVWATDRSSNEDSWLIQVGNEPGYTPLEIAIKQQDVEMVRILTTYNPDNRAKAEVSYTRFVMGEFPHSQAYPGYAEHFRRDAYWAVNDAPRDNRQPPSTLLQDALKTQNQKVVDLVIKAYTDSKKLYVAFAAIQASCEPKAMRSWIEQNVFLWNGERIEVADAVVELFMENRQGLNASLSDVETLLQHGWIVTRHDLEQALIANDPQMLQLLVAHSRLQENPFDLLAQYNRSDLVTYAIEKGHLPVREHLDIAITHGALDVVKTFTAHGVPFDGALISAAEQKQKAIVAYLLELPMDTQEIEEARAAAYRVHAYDIMELLEATAKKSNF